MVAETTGRELAEGARVSAHELCDPGTLSYFDEEAVPRDPLGWPGYPGQVERARRLTGARQAVAAATASIGGNECVLLTFNFAFFGGSMGEAEGATITSAFGRAQQLRVPVVSLVASGGARMQEGTRALMQMQVAATAIASARRDGIPHVSVAQHPTTGGVWASLVATADVIVGLHDARISFSGSRTQPHCVDSTDGELHSGGKWARGFIDTLSSRANLEKTLSSLLELLSPRTRGAPSASPPLPLLARSGAPGALRRGWDQVQCARSPRRARADEYLASYFDGVFEIRGDRCGGVDDGIRCGFGRRQNQTTAFVAQTGTATSAAGYRTASRLVQIASRLGLPVITFIDTPGAAASAADEAAGVGTAIAELLVDVASAKVPFTSVVIGEGGSGGALALAAPGRLWMAPDSYLAVTAPELATAILKRAPGDVADVADNLRLAPADLVELGVVRGIVGGMPGE